MIKEISELLPLGVGGVLAYVMFLIYRKDSKEWGTRWHEQAKLLLQEVNGNTKALTELVSLIRVVKMVDCPFKNGKEYNSKDYPTLNGR